MSQNLPIPPICPTCHKTMKLMLMKGTRGRRLQCIDCDQPDPLKNPDTQSWLKGELGTNG